jgi:lipoprotein-anchoring transpeptidase ErfK/SrfK
MNLRSAFALGVLATGLVAFGVAQAQPQPYYPPQNAQAYPPPRPLAPMVADDDDDLPANLRAAPGNYPPPPGGYVFPDQHGPAPGGIQREALPAPRGATAPNYGPPPVVYGSRDPNQQVYPPAYQQQPSGRGPVGNGQAESYGTAPQGYPPNQVPQPYGPPPAAYQGAPQGAGQSAPPRDITSTGRPNTVATLPPEEQPDEDKAELPPQFKRQLVTFQTSEPPGTIVIDTANTYLYLVLGNGQAMRYGIGVGREGFTWAGAERISRMKEWPDWYPPAEMIERQPYLPRMMAGGETNPLGARALYLGKTLYRIHGTNQPSTIGKYVSSGCIRLINDDIADLYSRVQVGTRVVVLPGAPPAASANAAPQQQPVQQR